jgi:hypothetical protein
MSTETAPKPALSAGERKLRNTLAKVLWATETDQDFADAAARKAAFMEARKTYMTKARLLAKALEKRGVSLSMTPDA